MIWPSCSTIISLAHIFAGQKYCRSVHSQLDSANWKELAIQRLLRATASGHPERQPLKSGARSSASATAVSVECIEPPPPTLDGGTCSSAARASSKILACGVTDTTFIILINDITTQNDQRHVVVDTSHDVIVMRRDVVREVLNWLDNYLGP